MKIKKDKRVLLALLTVLLLSLGLVFFVKGGIMEGYCSLDEYKNKKEDCKTARDSKGNIIQTSYVKRNDTKDTNFYCTIPTKSTNKPACIDLGGTYTVD